ncbi:hypothetical protein CABS01_04065 [Colletotrichum abscissum]|uniref:uncharacterized protein n=1 Tax=Colletotrichum abscissum TaxID=1671311 RepID=UPI0027D4E066|nr:uncharacterized protein CABS01_04065 [Colletotrichum abscissum]KAK1473403.1 hypothetical protein CABS01_04065 [Colletotrichum abscissum]
MNLNESNVQQKGHDDEEQLQESVGTERSGKESNGPLSPDSSYRPRRPVSSRTVWATSTSAAGRVGWRKFCERWATRRFLSLCYYANNRYQSKQGYKPNNPRGEMTMGAFPALPLGECDAAFCCSADPTVRVVRESYPYHSTKWIGEAELSEKPRR